MGYTNITTHNESMGYTLELNTDPNLILVPFKINASMKCHIYKLYFYTVFVQYLYMSYTYV